MYSSKSHFEAARRWSRVHLWMGVPTAILAGVAGVSALSEAELVAAAVAFLVAGFTGVITFLNPERRAANHQGAGTQYSALRNQLRIFRELEIEQLDEATVIERLKEFGERRDALNESSPPIPRWAFIGARKGIEGGEAEHEADRVLNP